MDVPGAEAAVHAAVAGTEQAAGVLDAARPADRRVFVEIVARDHVRIAMRRVLRLDGAQRESSRDVPIGVVDEDRPDLAPALEDAHGLAHGLRIPVGDVEVVAPAVHGDDDGAGREVARHLHPADLVLLPGLAALAPVLVHERGIDARPICLDAGSDRRERAVLAVERGETRAAQEVGEPHEAGDRVSVRVDVARGSSADRAQRDRARGSRDVAVPVVGNDEDVRRAREPQLRELGADAPEQRVV